MNWKIGDKAVYVGGAPGKGSIVIIESDLMLHEDGDTLYGTFPPGTMVHWIRDTHGTPGSAPPDHLRPLYDGHEPCAFDESIWTPHKEGVGA